jgi:2-polyprenyl-6-methoxyphenol hydroxylase-like FAD-dependent oxidoreductase
MHGIVLRRLGCSVLILERSPTEAPPSHMAGICLGADVLRLLDRFDRVDKVQLGLPSVQLQSLDNHGKAQPFLKASRVMSSWDAVYFRLRANFDFFASDYVLYPPAPEPMIGEDVLIAKSRAKYEVGKEVVDVKKSHTGRMLVTYKDYSNGCHEVNCEADLVLGADGPNSIVRKIFLGAAQVDRKYSGYVAWRGTVPEDQVSDKTREIFSANITYSILGGEAGHVIL